MALVKIHDLVTDPEKYNNLSGWSTEQLKNVIVNTPTFLRAAYMLASTMSHDPKTQIGAVIVNENGTPISSGANRLTRGMYDPFHDVESIRMQEETQSPAKYVWMEHSERNAVFNIPKSTVSTKRDDNFVMFCPYFACVDCARAIIAAEIKLVIGHKEIMDRTPERWKESIAQGRKLFDAAGVNYCEWSGLLVCPPVKHNGEDFHP